MPIALADLEIVRADPARHDVSRFDCGDADLNDFLKNDCFNYQTEYLSHTRLVYHRENLAAFITLLSDSIVLKTPEKKKLFSFHKRILSFPAVKIGKACSSW